MIRPPSLSASMDNRSCGWSRTGRVAGRHQPPLTARVASEARYPKELHMRVMGLGGPAVCTLLVSLVLAPASDAQVFTLSRDELVALSAQNPFERFPDGRPKVPADLIERARGLSAEEIWAVLPGKGFPNQYEDGFELLHPGTKLVGRAFTAQFMPMRPDIDEPSQAKAKRAGMERLSNQIVIDMLQPGDVLVVDLFGKKEGGTLVGDNLFYYIMKATKAAGLVLDGSIRDLEGIAEMPMPAYFRHAHPTPIANVMLTGINIPIRIGNATVMPGDLVFGDREGVYFVPPVLVKEVLDRADETHIHDEWTKKKFDEGKYRSSEIYGSPRDPALKKEYEEYLKKRLEELRRK
jgi:4-hydroxy-4-methyl-2-oxoglutarate aldolase